MSTRIIVIDDEIATLDLMRFQLESEGYEVVTASTGQKGLELVKETQFDIVLTDLRLPDINGIEIVKACKEISPESEIIMVTGYGSVNKAVEATKAGAYYFIEKPIEIEELLLLTEKALERKEQAAEIKNLRSHLSNRTSYFDIIGGSRAMQNIYEIIDSVAESDANILILGESGTGKELIANAIHYKSLRAKKPFVKVNCSALPKDLFESELFGHTKGAFTGATSEKTGLIGRATGGSLMLDEIGEMPIELQPKLLRVLQERVFHRLGSEKPQEADFRLISATNRNPFDSINEGFLREDLFYRINTIEIQIPPLRERAEDISRLADHFLKMFAEKYNRPIKGFSQQVYEQMFEYSWQGNVRELQNTVERAVLLCKGEVIEETSLPVTQRANIAAVVAVGDVSNNAFTPSKSDKNQQEKRTMNTENLSGNRDDSEMSLDEIAEIIVGKLNDANTDSPNEDVFSKIEAAVVSAALERTKGNKQAAANLLGLYRPRLYGMIKRHNLQDKF